MADGSDGGISNLSASGRLRLGNAVQCAALVHSEASNTLEQRSSQNIVNESSSQQSTSQQPPEPQSGARPKRPSPATVNQLKKARKSIKADQTRRRTRIYDLIQVSAPIEEIRTCRMQLITGLTECMAINSAFIELFPPDHETVERAKEWLRGIEDATTACLCDVNIYLRDTERAGHQHTSNVNQNTAGHNAFGVQLSRSPPPLETANDQQSSSSSSSEDEQDPLGFARPPQTSHDSNPFEFDASALLSNFLSKFHCRPGTSPASQPPLRQDVSHPSPPSGSWIAELSRASNGQTTAPPSWLMSLLPRTSIPLFDGNPREWPLFSSQFKTLVHDIVPNDGQRLAILLEHLGPRIKNRFARTFNSPDLYLPALRELERRYGNPRHLATTTVDDLLSHVRGMNGKPFDFHLLEELSERVHSAVIALQHGGQVHDLNSAVVLRQISQALPEVVARRWVRYTLTFRPRIPSLLDFDTFLDEVLLEERALRESRPTRPKPTRFDRQTPNARSSAAARGTPAQSSSAVLATYTESPKKRWCIACQSEEHVTYLCQRFRSFPPSQRAEIAKESGFCFRCLNGRHIASDCRTPISCRETGCRHPNRHHTLLHGARRVFPPSQPDAAQPSPSATAASVLSTSASVLSTSSSNCIALNAVVPLRLYAGEKFVDTFAMLDPGSQVTMVREDIASILGVTGRPSHIRLGTFHGQDPPMSVKTIDLRLASRDQSFAVDAARILIVPSLFVPRYSAQFEQSLRKLPYLSDLDVWNRATQDVTTLIGVDVQDAHIQLDHRRPPRGVNGPIAIQTPLGWCLLGKAWVADEAHARYVHHVHVSSPPSNELLSLVESHWRTESFGTLPGAKPPPSKEDARCLTLLQDSIKLVDGHYQVALPWKQENPAMPDNKGAALRRFYAVERRLLRDPALASAYENIIEDYVRRGFASHVATPSILPRSWFLPHHAVFNPNKPGSIRLVFDASACHNGVSLNKMLVKGPDLMTSLFSVLLRFRERQFAVSADIQKMFHQVLVEPADRASLQFWWRSPGSPDHVRAYHMNVHIFGAISSPTVCIFVLHQIASENAALFPDTARRIVDNFYVDNYLDSFDSEEEAVTVSSRIRDLLQLRGFKLVKWLSLSRKVIATFPSTDRNCLELDFVLDDLPVERTLGYAWSSNHDVFIFRFNANAEAMTRRQLLSAVSSIFDPLGLIAPILFIAKCLLQDTWRESVDWDEDLPSSIISSWRRWCLELKSLDEISVPRCISPSTFDGNDVQLHLFGDASERGFGSAAYLRVSSSVFTSVRLVAAKSRLAPLRCLTIPKLELQAAVLSTRLATAVRQDLRVQASRIVFWTDSQTVLCWLNSSNRRTETFVANRVGEILDSSRLEQWRHVPGALNPADDVSRGLWPRQIDLSHRWFNGPDFLYSLEAHWPTSVTGPPPEPDLDFVHSVTVRNVDHGLGFEKFCRRFIIYSRLIRVLSWIRRLCPRNRLGKALQPELSA